MCRVALGEVPEACCEKRSNLETRTERKPSILGKEWASVVGRLYAGKSGKESSGPSYI